MCISWTNKGLDIISMHGASTKIVCKLMFMVLFFMMKIECNNFLLTVPQFWQYSVQKKEHCSLLAVKFSNNILSSRRNCGDSLCF